MRITTKFIVTTALISGIYFFYANVYKPKWGKVAPVAFQTIHPDYRTIVRKKVFSGSLLPYKEIKLNAHVTGIIDKLLVQVGTYVQKGAPIARIKIQANPKEVEAAQSKLRLVTIDLNQARSKYARIKQLFIKKMIAKEAYEASLATWEQAKENCNTAKKALQIAQLGYTPGKGATSNMVKATTQGTILALPVKEGSMVQGSDQTASATTVAVVGDMDYFLFSAKVSELDVVHLTKGMTFTAYLNAFNDERLQVTLTKISPKASEEALDKGEVKFEIEGIVKKEKKRKVTLRAGYLALAEVILEKVTNVLAVPESMIHMEGKKYFVKCLRNGKAVEQYVVLGLSDGCYVQVKEGLTEQDQLIVEA